MPTFVMYDEAMFNIGKEGSSSVIANGNTRTWTVGAGLFEITVP